jgi:hypothetical protein
MRSHKEMILESMNSMLASAQLEAQPGITFQKFIVEFETLRGYPKKAESGKFSYAQIGYIKKILDGAYRVRKIGNEQYYVGSGLLI